MFTALFAALALIETAAPDVSQISSPAAASSAPSEPVSSGPSQPTDAAASDTGSGNRPPSARQQYDEQYLDFEDGSVVGASGRGGPIEEGSRPVYGKYRRVLADEEFYRMVERPDLVSRYQKRRWVRNGLMVVGGLTIVGAYPAAIGVLGRSPPCVSHGDGMGCLAAGLERLAKSTEIVLIAGGVGLGLFLTGVLMNPQPIEPGEARSLAGGYNQKLRTKLGLEQADSASERAGRQTFPPLSADYFIDHGGGGILLGAHF
jgi:hypothetical protein